MNTLTTASLAPLLDRLSEEAVDAESAMRLAVAETAWASLSGFSPYVDRRDNVQKISHN
jgi:hypothetical protein